MRPDVWRPPVEPSPTEQAVIKAVRPGEAVRVLAPAPASAVRRGVSGRDGQSLNDRKDETMARTLPIPAEQPLDAAWKAAGRVASDAGRRRGGGRAGGSLLHAGRTAVAADPRSPRNGWPGQRAGPMAAATPAPGAAGGRGHARIGRCGTGRDGARRPAGGGARGRCDHAGGRGGVRAPGPVHRRHGAGRRRSGADARRGAGRAAGADAVPGGDRNQGVHRPGRRSAASWSGCGGSPRPPRRIWAAAWWRPGSRRTARPGWPP